MIAAVRLLYGGTRAGRRAARHQRKLDQAALDGEFALDRPHGLLRRFAALARDVKALEQARIASAAAPPRQHATPRA